MRTPQHVVLCAAFLALTGTAAHGGGSVWSESADGGGDAGDSMATAQKIMGNPGLVSHITGNVSGPGDVDLYEICLDDVAAFEASAQTSDTGVSPYLFLFDSSGNGIAFHAAIDPADPSVITNQFVLTAGTYFLAATSRNATALGTGGNPIWLQTLGTESAPDGAGAPGPLTGWNFGPNDDGTNYVVTLSGVDFFVPTPGALALLGLAGLVGRRRRRIA